MSSPEHVFWEIARILSNRQNQILEIEILQPSFGPLLQDGCSIGITKKALVQAFVVARRIFLEKLVSLSDHELRATASQDGKATATGQSMEVDASVISQIILLFDCEHLTACNWRKRRLAALINDVDLASISDAERGRLVGELESELTLLTTFLCSPLHRHTKSPTLWQHRLWILNQMMKVHSGHSIDVSVSPSANRYHDSPKNIEKLVEAELGVALRAGELHPKNYYAFSYMRQLHNMLVGTVEERQNDTGLARSMINRTVDWCLAHPRDISGWMFALYLLETVQDRDFQIVTINRAVRFALDVGWEGESLWTFVGLTTQKFGLVETIQHSLQQQKTDSANVTMQDSVVDDSILPDKQWKLWLARARAHWEVARLADQKTSSSSMPSTKCK